MRFRSAVSATVASAVLLDLVTVAVLAFVGVRLVTVARAASSRPELRRRVLTLVRGIRLRHVVPIPFVLAAVLVAASLLLQVPGFDWGWWTAIGGYGNPVTGSSERTVGTVFEWAIPLVFGLLLLPGLPLFAEAEERIFRLGAERWSWPERVARGVLFGLVHAVVGLPIGVALALSVGGWWFTAVYLWGVRRGGTPAEGLLESTRAHTAYNGAIVLLLLASLLAYT
jgi:hypothetical protein